MKTLVKFLGIGVTATLLLGAPEARATLEVGVSVRINAKADFDAPLSAHGAWITVGSYGHCWRPTGVSFGWRPYCSGQWIWTDCGWYWASDEPWAWACYHYGRWVYDSDVGWVWVPDIEWAPAWVYWRVGGGYVGWAPCPPGGVVVAPALFAFVEVGHFHDQVRPRTVIVNNTTIINQTKVINNVREETRTIDGRSQKVFVNEGPSVETVQKAGSAKISAVPIQEAAKRTPVPSTMTHKKEKSVSKETTPQALPKDTVPQALPKNTTPQPPLKNEPQTPPRKEPPSAPPTEAPPGSVPRHDVPPSQTAPAPGKGHHKGHSKSHGRGNYSPVPPPARPAEPAPEKGDQAHPTEKAPGPDKDKP